MDSPARFSFPPLFSAGIMTAVTITSRTSPASGAANRIIRVAAVCERTGLSRTTVWRLERQGAFPARRRLSPGAVGWLESEVDEWIASRLTVLSSLGRHCLSAGGANVAQRVEKANRPSDAR